MSTDDAKVTLAEWAAAKYRPRPSDRTLRRWVKAQLIIPAPVLIGRTYYVAQHAVYATEAQNDLVSRLRAA